MDRERCAVSRDKIVTYLLNPRHPEGKSKARFFGELGYTSARWELLADALSQVGRTGKVVDLQPTPYGDKMTCVGLLASPSGGNRLVRTVWIREEGAADWRLITAFPERKTLHD